MRYSSKVVMWSWHKISYQSHCPKAAHPQNAVPSSDPKPVAAQTLRPVQSVNTRIPVLTGSDHLPWGHLSCVVAPVSHGGGEPKVRLLSSLCLVVGDHCILGGHCALCAPVWCWSPALEAKTGSGKCCRRNVLLLSFYQHCYQWYRDDPSRQRERCFVRSNP